MVLSCCPGRIALMRGLLTGLTAVLALLLGLGFVHAGETPVKESEVPKAAIDAVKKKYPKAKLTGFAKLCEREKAVYEVQIEDGKRRIEINLSPEGKILEEEETIAADDLPKEVKKGLADSKYGRWKIKKVERTVREENEKEPSYEIILQDGESRFEVVFDKAGKITSEEDHTARKRPTKKGAQKKTDDDDDD
jgi:hypothetical protein